MIRFRRFVGALLVLAGGVWFFQGIGVIQSESFMTDDPLWMVIGAIVAGAGLALLLWPRRSAP